MSSRWRNFCGFAVLAALLNSPAQAEPGAINIKITADSRDVTVSFRNDQDRCGMVVDFGDGHSEHVQLARQKTQKIHYRYTDFGEFLLTAKGARIKSTWRTLEPCEFEREVSLRVEAENYLLTLATPELIRFFKSVDGQRQMEVTWDFLAKHEQIGLLICYVPSSAKLKHDIESVLDATEEELEHFFNGMLGNQFHISTIEVKNCDFRNTEEAKWAQLVGYADFVIVQREFLPQVKQARASFQSSELVELIEIDYKELHGQAARIQQALAERQSAYAQKEQEFEALAEARSSEKVGSILITTPGREIRHVSFCTVAYDSGQEIAISEYAARAISVLPEQFQSYLVDVGATINSDSSFDRIYADVDEAYRSWQRNGFDCMVYVDFPSGLKNLANAIRRDQELKIDINQLVPTVDLKNDWARKRGHASYAEYSVINQNMRQMNVNETQYSVLSGFGVANRPSMESAIEEMNRSGYSDSHSTAVLVDYLRDRATATANPGATAASIRDSRNAREAAARPRVPSPDRSNDLAENDFSSVSGVVCRQHEHVLSHVITGYRQAGIPLNSAQSVFDSESDPSLRRFLKATTSGLYVNPEGVLRHIQSGEFLRGCIRVHRGY